MPLVTSDFSVFCNLPNWASEILEDYQWFRNCLAWCDCSSVDSVVEWLIDSGLAEQHLVDGID